jgi:pyrrolidone-carboxylate peptidase
MIVATISRLPRFLQEGGFPATVSRHAKTYICLG